MLQPTPLVVGLWMEGLGWSMIQKIFFGSGVYVFLGRVKFSTSYFEQGITKPVSQEHREKSKSASESPYTA